MARANLPHLPIEDSIPELLSEIAARSCVVLVAEPGAGKSTRVPVRILAARAELNLGPGKIVMLQPRRVAARALTEWIAHENNWNVGSEVGYQVRFEKRTSALTQIEIITEGILVQRLLNDPALTDAACVILDEFHERSIHLDLSLALLKESVATLRPDLKIVVMSATLDAETLLKYWPGSAMVFSEGRQFPVESTYSQTPISLGGGSALIDRVLKAVVNVADLKQHGHTLVFLPGVNEIRKLVDLAFGNPRLSEYQICSLHGQMTLDDQMRVLNPSEKNKIIFTTNIAETSLTVDGVSTVIDSGLVRMTTFDRRTGVESLNLVRASASSQRQRQGRAGRQAAGVCIKLWAKTDDLSTPAHTIPEILRADLADTVLLLSAWGVREPEFFDWFESPLNEDLKERKEFLQMLELLTGNGQLTELGLRIRAWPATPRLSRLIFESAIRGEKNSGISAAAILSERDFVLNESSLDEFAQGDSDLLARLHLLNESGSRRALHATAKRTVHQLADSFSKLAQSVRASRDIGKSLEEKFDTALLICYRDRICRRRQKTLKAKMIGGRGVELDFRSLCRNADYFLALEMRAKDGQADLVCTLAHPIPVGLFQSVFGDEIKISAVEHQSETGRWIRRETKILKDLELGFPKEIPLSDAESKERWKAALVANPLAALMQHEDFKRWKERVEIFNRFTDDGIDLNEAILKTWVEYWLEGHPTPASVFATSALTLRASLFSSVQLTALEKEVPDRILVPSGSWIKVTYRPNDPPILSVRLQELFGWTTTPVLAFGKLPLILELLGPNYRPIQITQDLKSFWSKTYFEIRKELRLKYPKHSWPEDPLTAAAVAKGRPRQS